MAAAKRYDLCVIGAGSAGLSVASGAAQLGLKTVLIEAGSMGGDCLNTGCVPSKAILAFAKHVHSKQHPGMPGIPALAFDVDRSWANEHVRQTIAAIAPHDSVERFEGLGVTVIKAHASFIDDHRIETENEVIEARNFVVAAGSRASLPKIPGLDETRVLTNETIFNVETVPEHLVIIGGGPIGIEMAQAHRRLGARVTVLDMKTILPKDDPDLVDMVRQRLQGEGVHIVENASIAEIYHNADGHSIRYALDGEEQSIMGSHLLMATGRRPNIEGLGLDRAGIAFDTKGIKIDARLRTTNHSVFAIGDIAGGPQFTHIAGYHAGIVIRNLAFRFPAKVNYRALPWVTYTDPELAHVGLTLTDARERHGDQITSLIHSFEGVDRAVAERRTEGLLKLVVEPNGRILGCSIAAPGAGELISFWALAITRRLKLRDVSDVILPYPTFGEIARQAASEWYKPTLFSDRTRTLVRLLRKLPSF